MDKVRVYSVEDCAFCTELKVGLLSIGVDYIDINVNLACHEDEFNELMKITKTDDVPVVIIDKKILAPNISFTSIEELLNIISDLY